MRFEPVITVSLIRCGLNVSLRVKANAACSAGVKRPVTIQGRDAIVGQAGRQQFLF